MGYVYVARHGETDWNREGRYQGQRESNLTPLGLRQAGALAGELKRVRVARVVSSPLRRCLDTASPIASGSDVSLETDARLLEIAHGFWEGRLRSEIERDDAERMRAWLRAPETVVFPGGEGLSGVSERWSSFAREQRGETNVAVVTHDVLVRIAILAATGRPLSELWQPRVVNGGYAVFETNDRWHLVEECHDLHLAGLFADASRQAL